MTGDDDIMSAITARVVSLLTALDEDARMLGIPPSDLASFDAMSEPSRVGARALLKTVEQLEDQMMRLFRTILHGLDVDVRGLYARDIANRMEKLGLIEADDWMTVVRLRNRLVHDYPLARESRFSKLAEAIAAADTLRRAGGATLTFVDRQRADR